MVSRARGLRPAVFLDRDGVIVVPEFRDGRSFAPRRLEDFRLYPEAAASLKKLKQAGFLLAVVTNQPDVGNGLVDRSEVDAMHEIITRELPVDAIKACFHRQIDNCDCRTPQPGMILEAASDRPVSAELRSARQQRDRGSPRMARISRHVQITAARIVVVAYR